MILTSLIYLLTSIFNVFLSLLPVASSDVLTLINSGLSDFKTVVASANWLFPVNTFFSFLGIIVIMESALFTYKLIKWITALFTLGTFKG